MKRLLGGFALIGLALSLAGTAQAQTQAFPVWYSPAFGSGVGIFADWATGLNDDAKFGESAPMTFGGHIQFGASVFKASFGAWYLNPKVDGLKKPVDFGGNLGVTIFKGTSPLVVDLMAGAGYSKIETDDTVAISLKQTAWNFPIGLPIAYGAQLEGGHTIEPWIAPILQIYNWKIEGIDGSNTDIGFGVSGGINFYSAMGLGAFVVLDWQSVTFEGDTESTKPFRLGAGLSWRFAVPSLPEAKGFAGG